MVFVNSYINYYKNVREDLETIIVQQQEVQPHKLCNKYMIVSTQITNFAFIAVLAFKLLYRNALFINRKGNRNCYKVGYSSTKSQISRVNYCKTKNNWDAKFSGYFSKSCTFHRKTTQETFQCSLNIVLRWCGVATSDNVK